MLGPFSFDRKVNGQNYLKFFNEVIYLIPMTVLFQNQFHENRFQLLWRAQDEAACHGLLAVHARLNHLFGEIVLTLHNNEWLPRSPDLNPCDFFLWSYLKDKGFYNSSRKFESPTANNNS